MPSRANSWNRRPSTADRRHHRGHLLDPADEVLGHDAARVVERDADMSNVAITSPDASSVVGGGAEHHLAGVPLASSPTKRSSGSPCRPR
jgi:hypothetical protein